MKPNELRIGNLILHDKDIVNVTQIINMNGYCINGIGLNGYTHYGNVSNYFKPIPLNEEMLLKLGFEVRESSVCKEYYIGLNDITHDWLFSITWLEKPELINAPNAPFYRNGKHTIYYVHQLQNLYFALTGEELDISNI